MSKKKKSGHHNKSNPDSKINLITAIINLLVALTLGYIALKR